MNDHEFSVQALRQKDRSEFDRLVDSLSDPLYRLALKMLGNPQDAEDVLQNTFIKAMLNIDTFEQRSSLSTWLYRIAVNESLMLLRKKKPEVSLDESTPDDDQVADYAPKEFTDWCCLPEEEFLNAESRQMLDSAIRLLPETLRVVFLLRDIEGLSIQETSEALDLTETAVKTRLLRARLRLREHLSGFYSERVKSRKDEHE